MNREKITLDGTWDFCFDPDASLRQDDHHVPKSPQAGWRKITVPSPWQAQCEDLREEPGVAWYRHRFTAPVNWKEPVVLLHFGAAHYYTEVWLNGVFLGEHEGGFLPFEFEASPALQPGETNELLVRVTAPSDDPQTYPQFPFAEIPHGKQSWYGFLGGIWQSVWLEKRSSFHVRAMRLTPKLSTGQVQAHLTFSKTADRPYHVQATLFDPAGNKVASLDAAVPAGSASVDFSLMVDDPLPWSPDHPHLYAVQAQILRDEEVMDTKRDRVGFRTIEARAGRLFLNGEPLYLRGVLDQAYYPDTIYTPPSEAFLENQLRLAKKMGFNCLRCHIKVADPRYYEVADRLGMLIWTELPNWHQFTERAAQRGWEILQGILARDGNHPSIIAWTIINEDWGTDLVHDATHRAWLKETFQQLKRLDPTRLVVDNSPCWPNVHVQTDLEDYHYYRALPDHRQAWDEFICAFAERPEWTFSPHGDAVRCGDEPLIVSEFGNWGLPDVDLLLDAKGREPWWFETGSEWGEGVAYPHGVRRRFRTWHLDRVFDSWHDLVEATQWQQFSALKYEIESIRRQAEIAGYVVTELTDVFWEGNGLLDMRRNPRVFCGDFAPLNAETVVIPVWDRVAYWAGEPVQVGISVAHGAGPNLENCEVRWALSSGESAGTKRVPDLSAGQVETLQAVTFKAPDVASPMIQRLDLELRSDTNDQLASNHLALAIFPQRDAPACAERPLWVPDPELAEHLAALGYSLAPNLQAAHAVVTQRLDKEWVSYVREGGRLLLLADQPEAMGPGLADVQIRSRADAPWEGDWISSFAWVRRKGPLARLPGGPLLDHSFERVIPECVLTGILPWEFEAHVHAGLFVGWIHQPVALIAERRYGRGRAVLTTFRLTNEAPQADPTATLLLDALVELTFSSSD